MPRRKVTCNAYRRSVPLAQYSQQCCSPDQTKKFDGLFGQLKSPGVNMRGSSGPKESKEGYDKDNDMMHLTKRQRSMINMGNSGSGRWRWWWQEGQWFVGVGFGIGFGLGSQLIRLNCCKSYSF
jgi:hypothetical protein